MTAAGRLSAGPATTLATQRPGRVPIVLLARRRLIALANAWAVRIVVVDTSIMVNNINVYV